MRERTDAGFLKLVAILQLSCNPELKIYEIREFVFCLGHLQLHYMYIVK